MDHMRLDALRPEPTRKPETVATGLVGNNDTRDRVARPHRLAAPALEQRQQGVLVGLQFLQRLALDARHETCNEPARCAISITAISVRSRSRAARDRLRSFGLRCFDWRGLVWRCLGLRTGCSIDWFK